MSLLNSEQSLLQENYSWIDILPKHEMFNVSPPLAPAGDTESGQYLLCESRGDLFLWNPNCECLLTTNLKRLHSKPEGPHIYQKLHPLAIPPTNPNALLPSPGGSHIAIVGGAYVNVLELRKSRGPHGEFSRGVKETDCRSICIGTAIIRAHCLTVKQAQWIPAVSGLVNSDSIAVFTSDESLRIFSLSSPSVPQLTLNMSLNPAGYSHGLKLPDDSRIVSFSLMGDMAFLLQEQLDVQTIQLREGSLPATLPIHNFDDYNERGCGLLLLSTQFVPVLVLASNSGTIFHCIYMRGDHSLEENDDEVMVVERISVGETDNCEHIKLLADPLAYNNYCIQTSTAVYYVHLPWIANLEQFSHDAPPFSATPPCSVNQILCTPNDDIHDALMISDPLLGEAVITVYSDGTCSSLKSDTLLVYPIPLASAASPVNGEEQLLTNEFVHQIQLLFTSAKEQHQLTRPKQPSPHEETQKSCYEFLSHSIETLRNHYLSPQHDVKLQLIKRIKHLEEKRNRQLEEVLEIEEEAQDIANDGENLTMKVQSREGKCQILMARVERIGCLVAKASPVLSDAEKSFAKELISVQENLERLQQLLKKARAKIEIGLGKDLNSSLNKPINTGSMETVLTTVAENGTSIKESIQLVKELASAMNVTTVT